MVQPRLSKVYIVTPPQLAYVEAFANAFADYKQATEQKWIDLYAPGVKDFTAYVKWLSGLEKGINMPVGWVPETTRWLINKQQEIVGFARVRHRLTPTLEEESGHIGYDVPPAHRRKGYGTECLRVAIGVARDLGLQKVLLTCDSENLASKRIIEAAGATLRDEIILRWKPYAICRYWLQLQI